LIAFNHEQIKQCTTAGYLLMEKKNFKDISHRLFNTDIETLKDLSKRMQRGTKVQPETDKEKMCFQLLKDLDHVGGHVKGSLTSKKYSTCAMRYGPLCLTWEHLLGLLLSLQQM